MKIGVFITARLGSTRLQSKHLLPLKGKPIMGYLLERLSVAFPSGPGAPDTHVAIVTGNQGTNAPFATVFQSVNVFYGDDDNIPRRHLQAAEKYQCDAIVSIDGDDILVSPDAASRVAASLRAGAPLVKTAGLPLGMNAWGYSTACLRASLVKADYALLETGWGRIFEQVKPDIITYDIPDDDRLRFTLDYDDDFAFFSSVISDPGYDPRMNDRELVALVMREKYFENNAAVAREYWENFNRNVQQEEQSHK